MSNAEIIQALLESEDPFIRVLGILAELKHQRGLEYNRGRVKLEDYFPLGRASYSHMVYLKGLRAISLVESGLGIAYSPAYMDTMLDLANYAIFGAMAETAKRED
jgi:hypothetical protein